jgi:hypothetical protein
VGRVADGVSDGVARIGALADAIVPQVGAVFIRAAISSVAGLMRSAA